MDDKQMNGPDLDNQKEPDSNSGQYTNQQPNNQQQSYGYQQPQQPYAPYPGYQPKSRLAAGLLGIFLGVFGVHNFYLGYKGRALTQLLLSILTCGILSPISAIWGFVEGIIYLTDQNKTDAFGVPLQS